MRRRRKVMAVALVATLLVGVAAGVAARTFGAGGTISTVWQVCAGIQHDPRAWDGRIVRVSGTAGAVGGGTFGIGDTTHRYGPWMTLFGLDARIPFVRFVPEVPVLSAVLPVQPLVDAERLDRAHQVGVYRVRIVHPQYMMPDPLDHIGGCSTAELLTF